jgi:hypothetical protein
MLEKNKKLIEEVDRLEKGAFTGKITVHILKGIAMIVEFPKKPIRKELMKIGGTDNG